MKRAVLFLIVLSMICAAGIAHAGAELKLTGITFSTAPNGEVFAEIWVSADMDGDQGTFTFDFTMVQRRNGQTIRTWTASALPVVNRNNCLSCAAACGGSCKLRIIGKDFNGSCVNGNECGPSAFHCICKADDPQKILEYLIGNPQENVAPGDEFEVSIPVIEPNIDRDPTNNSLSVIY
jgi:hypothetical protein